MYTCIWVRPLVCCVASSSRCIGIVSKVSAIFTMRYSARNLTGCKLKILRKLRWCNCVDTGIL